MDVPRLLSEENGSLAAALPAIRNAKLARISESAERMV
jgi:hypothetical protein